jgi:excisionase family DNA binding protein
MDDEDVSAWCGPSVVPEGLLEKCNQMAATTYQEDNKPEPLLVTAQNAAALLGISRRYLYTLTKLGHVRAKRIGRKVLYRMSDLNRYIDEDSGGTHAALISDTRP